MFSKWLHRGLGQIVAPDPQFEEQEETAEREEFAGGIWNIIAPDPNFVETSSPTPKPQQSIKESQSKTDEQQDGDFATPMKDASEKMTRQPSFLSPSSSKLKVEPKVEKLALEASRGLTYSMHSPTAVWEERKNFHSFCASGTTLNEKKLKKVKKMLKKDHTLANARACNMGNLVPDGFTPLHTTALVGNYEVAEILIDFKIPTVEKEDGVDNASVEDKSVEDMYAVDLDARDVQGRTALHIAGEHGHVKIVELLKEKMKERYGVEPLGYHAPTDLTGRTPLGWAATSRDSRARKNMDQLRDALFSPGDKSVYGERTPAFLRTGSATHRRKRNMRPMDLTFGFADMPGHRIDMEDAICHAYPLMPPSKCDQVGFFGVFDGHGDGGLSSEYVAERIIPYFTSTPEWESYNGDIENLKVSITNACATADTTLKAKLCKGNSVKHGGSTGVMAIVTSDNIMVANVGDSRCILVQKYEKESKEPDVSEVTKELVELSLKNEKDVSSVVHKEDNISVKALSNDHKPSNEGEKERIEKAGMQVLEETFTIDGEAITISKIFKSQSDKIAVSRAFGDFDYKNNEDLDAAAQAIIAEPEVTIHKRDHTRDMFLILACDGIYDVMSNDEVGAFVTDKVDELSKAGDVNGILPEVGDLLLQHCLEVGSSDNMSVLIVALPKCASGQDDPSSTPRALNFADV